MRVLSTITLCMGLLGLGGLPTSAEAQTQVSAGQFQNISARYQGAGTVGLIETDSGAVQLHFDASFAVTPGPDLEVWLINGDVPTSSGQVLSQEYLSLGALRSPNGAQAYELPEGANAEDYDAVIIWCEDFSVLFTVAALN